jgi:hypothetical protein
MSEEAITSEESVAFYRRLAVIRQRYGTRLRGFPP